MRTMTKGNRVRSGREMRLMLSPKKIASAAGVSPRYAQMMCAGERDNVLGRAGDFFEAAAREGAQYCRALEFLQSKAEEGEMDVRDVAPETDYQAALQELHDQMAAALPLILAEIRGDPDPAAMEDAALDVAGAARLLSIRARQLQAAQRKERRVA